MKTDVIVLVNSHFWKFDEELSQSFLTVFYVFFLFSFLLSNRLIHSCVCICGAKLVTGYEQFMCFDIYHLTYGRFTFAQFASLRTPNTCFSTRCIIDSTVPIYGHPRPSASCREVRSLVHVRWQSELILFLGLRSQSLNQSPRL